MLSACRIKQFKLTKTLVHILVGVEVRYKAQWHTYLDFIFVYYVMFLKCLCYLQNVDAGKGIQDAISNVGD